MTDFGIITGSGFYDFPGVTNAVEKTVVTPFGAVRLTEGVCQGRSIAFLARHKKGHTLLPHMINYRANIAAMAQVQPRAVIATSICGIVNRDIPLGRIMIFNDLFFPDNRLPSGEICSIFTAAQPSGQGHLMFVNPFYDVSALFSSPDTLKSLTYGHVNGPRFNSRAEIAFYSKYCDAISQTCGPEAILCNELEIPYILLGFGVDYANGIMAEDTPVEVLNDNMARSKPAFASAIGRIIDQGDHIAFANFVYRFAEGE